MSAASWVYAQVWSKADRFRQGLGLLAISGEELLRLQDCGTGFFVLVLFCFRKIIYFIKINLVTRGMLKNLYRLFTE